MNYEDLEKIRSEYKKKVDQAKSKCFTIWLVVISAALFIAIMSRNGLAVFFAFSLQATIMIGIGGFLYTTFHTRNDSANYRKAYKAYFVSDALSKTFSEYNFNSEKGIDKFEIQKIGMMNTGDRFMSNDLVTGKYKGNSFKQSDVHIENESTDSDGNTTYTTIFKGRWIIFDFKKDLHKKLAVVGKGFNGAMASKRNGFKEIKLESADFHQHFNVYTQDGFEAYYVLDPAFMERTMALAEKHQDNVFLAFTDGQLHIGVHDGKDSFEPPSYKNPIDEAKEKSITHEEIKVITDIVDNLKLKA
ncbi:DUF3137 domain-containing protein [Candidatus Saccharibacteria bacterium]|nr:DUF3137 domain-containing protein [Candidatus Saccharibacteria bacterium]